MVKFDKLVKKLKKKRLKISFAESCTGGLLAHSITTINGASKIFNLSVVTYSNDSKSSILKVPKKIINKFGAVSEEVVGEMVTGALSESRANLGIAISGIAGPGGGSPERPVGTVCIAWKLNEGVEIKKTFLFDGNRNEVRYKTVLKALEGAIDLLK